MLTHCLKCKNNAEFVGSEVIKTRNGRSVLLSKCCLYSSKKSRFMKD